MSKHKQIKVKSGKTVAMIDELIAELIKETWHAFIETEESCQGDNDKKCFLCFPNQYNFKKFIKIMIMGEEDTSEFKERIQAISDYESSIPEELQWEMNPITNIYHSEMDEVEISVIFCINFPKSDISIINKKLKEYNKWRLNPMMWDKTI